MFNVLQLKSLSQKDTVQDKLINLANRQNESQARTKESEIDKEFECK